MARMFKLWPHYFHVFTRYLKILHHMSLSDSSINKIVLVVSAIFMLGGAANNGFSWFFPAIPFAIFFVIYLQRFSIMHQTWVVISMFVVCLPLAWNHSNNILLYPYLNSEVKFNAEWGYVKYSDSDYYSLIPPEHVPFYQEREETQTGLHIVPLELFQKSLQMKMVKMSVSHADFGTHLEPVFEDSSGNLFSIVARELMEGIQKGTIKSKDLQNIKDLQSLWTKYLGNLMYWPILPLLVKSMYSF